MKVVEDCDPYYDRFIHFYCYDAGTKVFFGVYLFAMKGLNRKGTGIIYERKCT
jgi:hypothetical protein